MNSLHVIVVASVKILPKLKDSQNPQNYIKADLVQSIEHLSNCRLKSLIGWEPPDRCIMYSQKL